MAFSEKEIREQICEAGRRLWLKGWVASNDGNISMKLDGRHLIATPTGVSKGFMTPEMLCRVDMDGAPVDGRMKPSSEIRIHIEAYRRRSDIGAVVHAHPPVSTGYAVANIPLDFQTLPEIIVTLGSIPLAPYGTPSTEELSNSIAGLIRHHDALLLANHGAVTVGGDVMDAYYKMERVEHFAQVSLVAHQLGDMRPLGEEDMRKLDVVRETYGIIRAGGGGTNGGCTAAGDAE